MPTGGFMSHREDLKEVQPGGLKAQPTLNPFYLSSPLLFFSF